MLRIMGTEARDAGIVVPHRVFNLQFIGRGGGKTPWHIARHMKVERRKQEMPVLASTFDIIMLFNGLFM